MKLQKFDPASLAPGLQHDSKSGWIVDQTEPRWRANEAAVIRVAGHQLSWLKRGGVYAAHREDGITVATMRYYRPHQRWIARIEGFGIWEFSLVLNKFDFLIAIGTEKAPEGQALIESVLKRAGAKF